MRLTSRSVICGSLAAVTAGLLLVGCASRGNVELLEARLREQEDELRALHSQVEQTQAELVVVRRINQSLNQRLVQQTGHNETFDLNELHFRVSGLKINTLLTGGFNRDGQPGDDQLTVVFAPQDDRGRPVRLPSTVECELLDPSQPPDQQRLGLWTFDAEQTNAAWQKMLGSSAYRFQLPWQQPPRSSSLEVRVRVRSKQGDHFEASSPVKVILPSTAG